MSKELGHRLSIEVCAGTPLLNDVCEHLSLFQQGDQGRRLQEISRSYVSVGCILDDFGEVGDFDIQEVLESIHFIDNSEDEMMAHRFRLYSDDEDAFSPGFSTRYLSSPKLEKKLFVTKLYLLGFWFFTRFNEQFQSLVPASDLVVKEDNDVASMPASNGQAVHIEHNEDAANMFGDLDICF